MQGRRVDLSSGGKPEVPEHRASGVRRLVMLDGAQTLSDLAAMRSDRLEPLRGARAGQYSIRVNDQWRICFVWRGNDAWDVEIVDYH